MFCHNCGNAMTGDSIFCSACGTKKQAVNQESPKQAEASGQDQAQRSQQQQYQQYQQYQQQQQLQYQQQQQMQNPPQPKQYLPHIVPNATKKSNAPMVAIIVAVTVLLLGGGAIFALTMLNGLGRFGGSGSQSVSGEGAISSGGERAERSQEEIATELALIEDDPIDFLETTTRNMFDSILGQVLSETTTTLTNLPNAVGSLRGGFNVNVSVSANDRIVDELAREFPEINEIRGLVKLLLDSGIEIGGAVDAGSRDLLASIYARWLVQRNSVLTAEAMLSGNDVYIGVPELYNKYAYLNLRDEFGIDIEEMMGELDDLLNSSNDMFDELMGELEPFFAMLEMLEGQEALLDSFIEEALQAVVTNIKDIRFYNDRSVMVNGRSATYNEIVVNLTEKDVMEAFVSIMEIIRDNDEYISLIVDIMNELDPWSYYSIADLRDEINYQITSLAQDLVSGYYDSSESFVFNLYLDKSNNLVGITFDVDGYEAKLFLDFSHGYEFMFSESGYNTVRVHGSLSGNANSFTGDMEIYYNDNYDEINIKLMEFDVQLIGNSSNVRLTFFLGELAQMADPYAFPGYLGQLVSDARLELVIRANPDGAYFSFELYNRAEGASIMLTIDTGSHINPNTRYPSQENIISFYDIENVLYGDIFTILGNLTSIIEDLERSGYDVSIINELMYSLF